MITRILFIDSDAEALARIKQALEQAGDYEAKVFVTGQAALEYAIQNPPAVAVISLNVQDIALPALADRLRRIRPGLPLLLRAPAESDESIIQSLAPQGVIRGGYAARRLIALVEDVLKPQPVESGKKPAVGPGQAPKADASALRQYLETTELDDVASFGEILESIEPDSHMDEQAEDTFDVLVKSLQTRDEKPSLPLRRRIASWARAADQEEAAAAPSPEDSTRPADEAPSGPETDALFQKLAAEEPPLPTLEDTGTVRDLIAVTDFNDQADSDIVEIPDEMIRDLSEVSPVPKRPLDELEEELLEALAAADAPDGSPPPPPDAAVRPQTPELIPMPDDIRAQLEGDVTPVMPAIEPEAAASPPGKPPADFDSPPLETSPEGNVDAARLAVQLTQHTLESSAQATVLLRDDEVIATAGALPDADIAALAEMIDCAAVRADEAIKIKFVSLPETGLNYMAVAAPTVENMVLVMVFTEHMHLRGIRQQAKTLIDALRTTMQERLEEAEAAGWHAPGAEARALPAALPADEPVPDALHETPAPDPSEQILTVAAEPEETRHGVTGVIESEGEDAAPALAEAEEPQERDVETREPLETAPAIDPATMVKYACAWILRDPDDELDEEVVKALPNWLDQIITSHYWLAEQIDVQPDYISVVVSVTPGETPSQVVETLMVETARRILAARPDFLPVGGGAAENGEASLWADAYYVIAPGRPLTNEEISNFISYQRQG